MFIRVKTSETTDRNVNVKHIRDFAPNGDGAVITFTDGTELTVSDTTRSLRSYIKKALGLKAAKADTSEDGE